MKGKGYSYMKSLIRGYEREKRLGTAELDHCCSRYFMPQTFPYKEQWKQGSFADCCLNRDALATNRFCES
jgi:hypothetical protein